MIGSVILKALALVLWLLGGIFNLTSYRVSKGDYAMCWGCLLCYLFFDVVGKVLEVMNG